MLDARFSQLYFGPSLNTLQRELPANAGLLVICAIAIWTDYKIGLRLSVCVSVRLRALSRSHFLIDFHQNWHIRKQEAPLPRRTQRVRRA